MSDDPTPIHVFRHHSVARGLEAAVAFIVTGDRKTLEHAGMAFRAAREVSLPIGTTTDELMFQFSCTPMGQTGMPDDLCQALYDLADVIVYTQEGWEELHGEDDG